MDCTRMGRQLQGRPIYASKSVPQARKMYVMNAPKYGRKRMKTSKMQADKQEGAPFFGSSSLRFFANRAGHSASGPNRPTVEDWWGDNECDHSVSFCALLSAPQLCGDTGTGMRRPEAENSLTGESHAEEVVQSSHFPILRGVCFNRRNPAGSSAGAIGAVSGRGSFQSVPYGEGYRNRTGSQCCSRIHFGRSGGAGSDTGRIHHRSQGRKWLCLSGGAIVG